jgi:hypothetical protein
MGRELTEIELSDKRREVVMLVRRWYNLFSELLDIAYNYCVPLLRPPSCMDKRIVKSDGFADTMH